MIKTQKVQGRHMSFRRPKYDSEVALGAGHTCICESKPFVVPRFATLQMGRRVGQCPQCKICVGDTNMLVSKNAKICVTPNANPRRPKKKTFPWSTTSENDFLGTHDPSRIDNVPNKLTHFCYITEHNTNKVQLRRSRP